jgi:hypothetical protein
MEKKVTTAEVGISKTPHHKDFKTGIKKKQ